MSSQQDFDNDFGRDVFDEDEIFEQINRSAMSAGEYYNLGICISSLSEKQDETFIHKNIREPYDEQKRPKLFRHVGD